MIGPPPSSSTRPADMHLSSRRRWIWFKLVPIAAAALLLAVIWGVTCARLADEREFVIGYSGAGQRNLARIITEDLRAVVDRASQYAMAAGDVASAGRRSSTKNLSSLLVGDRAFDRAVLFDLDGHVMAASVAKQLSGELLDRVTGVAAQIRQGTFRGTAIGPISDAFDEAWLVPLLLPVGSSADDYVGILMLHLDLGYLLRLYQDIEIGRSGAIQIFRDDGRELARARSGGLEITDKIRTAIAIPTNLPHTGTATVASLGAAHPRLISFDRAQGYPFVVGISQETDEILDEYNSRRGKYLVTLGVLTAAVLALTAIVLMLNERLHRNIEVVIRSEREKAALIDQLEEEKQHAYELASSDHLTGLANRRMFMALAASHIAQAKRSRKHYAIVFLDLDRFKSVNDSLGHKVGDLLLQVVAQRLRDGLRQADIIGRLGGDEFVILITGVESENDVATIASKLVVSISEPCADLDGHEVQVSPSIGVALHPRDGETLETLMRHADLAMYQSKRAGPGRYTFFDAGMKVKATGDFDLEQRLPRAIEAGEFVLHYQPKLDLQSHQVCGFEALIRWQHPDHGLIYPNEFIPLSESTGHVIELGNWVIAAACRQLAEWRSQGLSPLPVAVNLSGRQFKDKSLADRIVTQLREFDLPPRLLHVEVTESSLVESIDEASDLLSVLVTAGIKVALDDFGNGFSSLGYIKTLPIDSIKIDRGFVRDILNSHDDSVIVLSTISLAHNLGMRVIAEGVETRAQAVHLKAGGCDEVQGYYLSRPVPAAEAAGWIGNPVRNLI